MAIMQIKKYPEEILRKKTDEITKINGDILKLAKDMLETMYFFSGVGLAANQVGISKSIFVSDIKPEGKKNPIIVINPRITSSKGGVYSEEGCLSLPGIAAEVKRSKTIRLLGLNTAGKEIDLEVEGLLARIFQHEIDHLNGNVFIDRINPLKRWRLKREYFKKK
ncbi:MAG: peptide deformylase [Elusimicrobia bacterium RIFOXYC2_FULL_34_12]|nr:MAG: peptide deformylase [Elusimicrobia bacterium RIFOXYC2_FULL_34_12]OGS39019.1 MAG: peptide deformylase [Elusimicrobia bacterium RIFOXYD2_FULL_34_30]HAM39682.1 peptide deformylase [Elusimicrobiota bacterium]